MSLAQMIRAHMGGRAAKPRLESGEPDEEVEDNPPEEGAEGDDPEADAEGEEPKAEGEEDEPEAEGEEDEPEQMSAADRKIFAAGRTAERNRIAGILGTDEADANPGLAAHLAFATTMSAKDAGASLKAAGGKPAARGTLGQRMERAPNPQVGGMGGKAAAKDQPSRIHAASMAAIEAKRKRGR